MVYPFYPLFNQITLLNHLNSPGIEKGLSIRTSLTSALPSVYMQYGSMLSWIPKLHQVELFMHYRSGLQQIHKAVGALNASGERKQFFDVALYNERLIFIV